MAAGSLESVLDGVADRQQHAQRYRPLVLVHASRLDVILGLLAAHASAAGPHAGGIVVTGHRAGQLHGHAERVLQVGLALQDLRH